MTIKPVDMKDLPLTIEAKGWQIVWKGRPDLRVEFEYARFCQRGNHGIRRHQ
jgi:hypothetical protein